MLKENLPPPCGTHCLHTVNRYAATTSTNRKNHSSSSEMCNLTHSSEETQISQVRLPHSEECQNSSTVVSPKQQIEKSVASDRIVHFQKCLEPD